MFLFCLVPITLHDRTLEGLLTLPAPVITTQTPRQTTPVVSIAQKSIPTIQATPPSASPPIIVSSPIKLQQQEKEFMPAAVLKSNQEKSAEPLATFSLGDDLPSSSPKHLKPPPPPGATHREYSLSFYSHMAAIKC